MFSENTLQPRVCSSRTLWTALCRLLEVRAHLSLPISSIYNSHQEEGPPPKFIEDPRHSPIHIKSGEKQLTLKSGPRANLFAPRIVIFPVPCKRCVRANRFTGELASYNFRIGLCV